MFLSPQQLSQSDVVNDPTFLHVKLQCKSEVMARRRLLICATDKLHIQCVLTSLFKDIQFL